MTWVDLPGYGYAKASGAELSRWSKLIGEYCENVKISVGLFWLVDIRHIGTKADIDAWNWFSNLDIPVFTVLTKADKLTASQRAVQVKTVETVPCLEQSRYSTVCTITFHVYAILGTV